MVHSSGLTQENQIFNRNFFVGEGRGGRGGDGISGGVLDQSISHY